MEKGNGGRVLSILALVIAVAGLSIGFAAYTSTLNITASANVEMVGNWSVGFGNTIEMADLTNTTTVAGTGVTNAGTIEMLKYTIYQGTPATLSATNGSSVSYAFKVRNDGSIAATLASMTGGGLTCAYNSTAETRVIEQDTRNIGARITPESGTIDSDDCAAMFNATLTIGSTTYNLEDLANETFSGTINGGNSVDAVLTISATGTQPSNGDIVGDFIVTLGATTVVYSSASAGS